MSKIDDLIAKLCPEGVEFRELGELLGKVVGSNKKIVKSDIKREGKYPVYTQGANQMPDGYSDDENNVVDDVPVILYGDHTNSLKWIDHEFIAGADGVKMIKTDLKYDISDKFLFHCMREQINLIPNDYARHFSKVRNLKIPLPPLAVQREIVDILDKFTQLEAELEAELEARKKQYEHYRNQLLTFDDNAGGYDGQPSGRWRCILNLELKLKILTMKVMLVLIISCKIDKVKLRQITYPALVILRVLIVVMS